VKLEDIQEAVQGLPVTHAVIRGQDPVPIHPDMVVPEAVEVGVVTVEAGAQGHPAEENTGLLADPP